MCTASQRKTSSRGAPWCFAWRTSYINNSPVRKTASLTRVCKLQMSVLTWEIIQESFSHAACSLRLYGSCLTRFAFKTSDINIDVSYPSTVSLNVYISLVWSSFATQMSYMKSQNVEWFLMFSDDSAWRVDPGAGDLKEQRLVCRHLPTKPYKLLVYD